MGGGKMSLYPKKVEYPFKMVPLYSDMFHGLKNNNNNKLWWAE